MSITVDRICDAKGLACPMPIVRTKKAIEEIDPGQVLEVQATDRGSLADLQAWAKNTGHQYLGSIEEGDVIKHYLRKADPSETKQEIQYPHVVNNDELLQKLQSGESIRILDVREPAEYVFQHIPNAVHIPFGELQQRVHELNPDEAWFVVCRTGNRSDLAAQWLSENGFKHVFNVVPGMSAWQGPVEKG